MLFLGLSRCREAVIKKKGQPKEFAAIDMDPVNLALSIANRGQGRWLKHLCSFNLITIRRKSFVSFKLKSAKSQKALVTGSNP